MVRRSMQEFAALGSDKVEGVLDALGCSMAADPPDSRMVEGLQKMGLTADQARSMIGWFCDFRIGARNPGLMVSMLEAADGDDEAKRIAIDAFRRVAGRKSSPSGPYDLDSIKGPMDKDFVEYKKFVRRHRDDPELKDKYVAIVNGKYQKCGPTEEGLIREMDEKFGDVDMMVGPVSGNLRTEEVRTPRLL